MAIYSLFSRKSLRFSMLMSLALLVYGDKGFGMDPAEGLWSSFPPEIHHHIMRKIS